MATAGVDITAGICLLLQLEPHVHDDLSTQRHTYVQVIGLFGMCLAGVYCLVLFLLCIAGGRSYNFNEMEQRVTVDNIQGISLYRTYVVLCFCATDTEVFLVVYCLLPRLRVSLSTFS